MQVIIYAKVLPVVSENIFIITVKSSLYSLISYVAILTQQYPIVVIGIVLKNH